MRRFSFALCAFLELSAFLHVDAATVDQDFASATTLYKVAGNYEQSGSPKSALKCYNECYGQLRQISAAYPDWNSEKVSKDIADCFTQIDKLSLQINGRAGPLPIGSAVASAIPPPIFQSATRRYPWHSNINTRVFILGHDRTAASLDPHWVRNNSGSDATNGRSGYASGSHASTMNPFYVGLPFNDVAHLDLALRWLPQGWKPAKSTPLGSACLGRWVEITNSNGRTCFAQWEAADPAKGDNASYVFGASVTPKEAIGIHLSPAVAKYLGLDEKAVASWRFVDDDDVPPGLWMRYDEQAVLFSAIHAMKTGTDTSAAKGH